MVESDMENLAGQFLVATPQMPDPRFQEQVVYLCAHNHEGAMGLVINRPHPTLDVGDILRSAELPVPPDLLPPIYIGGPVEPEAGFVLYSGSSSQDRLELEVDSQIFLSRDTRLLEDIAKGKGPEPYLFLLGYAGWGPGQLESELMDNGWLTVPGTPEIIFHTPDADKWRAAAARLGIDISLFGEVIGNA